MSKDDYIRFRCSTDLKELVAKQAEEKGMNITDYMEYLIRKDRENMMYVYTCTYEWDDELLEKVINNGLAVPTDKDDNSHIISKLDKICIDGQTFNSTYTLEEYIRGFDGGDYVELCKNLEITKEDVIETFVGELYQPCDDSGMTYADKIYQSESPDEAISEYINKFLLIQIDFVMTDIKCKITQIEKDIKDGTLKWE